MRVVAPLAPRDAQPKLALRYDGRRRCFSLSPNRVLAFARAAGNAQCQCQRTNDSEELFHGHAPVSRDYKRKLHVRATD